MALSNLPLNTALPRHTPGDSARGRRVAANPLLRTSARRPRGSCGCGQTPGVTSTSCTQHTHGEETVRDTTGNGSTAGGLKRTRKGDKQRKAAHGNQQAGTECRSQDILFALDPLRLGDRQLADMTQKDGMCFVVSSQKRSTSNRKGTRWRDGEGGERERERERKERVSNATLFLWHDLSQRECVGRMIKCARQSCHKGNKCAIQHFPSARASFVPKLTTMFTVTERKTCPISRCIPSPCAHQSLGIWRRHRTTRPWRANPRKCQRRIS